MPSLAKSPMHHASDPRQASSPSPRTSCSAFLSAGQPPNTVLNDMSDRQTAIILDSFSLDDPLKAVRVDLNFPLPQAAPAELVVRVACRPINPADILALQGVYNGITRSLPTIPGIEGVGTVVGDGSRKYVPGTRVAGVPFALHAQNGGTWQEFVTVPEEDTIAVPSTIDDQTASQLYINPMTARGFFDILNIPKGHFLLQSAAGSVLGRQVIQFAKHYGIKTINLVRREAQKQELLDTGADHVLVTSGGDEINEQVQSITGDAGAYAAIDAVGGDLTGQLLKALRPTGQLLLYGAMSGLTFSAAVPDLLFEQKVLRGFLLAAWKKSVGRERFQTYLEEVIGLLDKGIVTTFNGTAYLLADVEAALQQAVKLGRGGKVFLTS